MCCGLTCEIGVVGVVVAAAAAATAAAAAAAAAAAVCFCFSFRFVTMAASVPVGNDAEPISREEEHDEHGCSKQTD